MCTQITLMRVYSKLFNLHTLFPYTKAIAYLISSFTCTFDLSKFKCRHSLSDCFRQHRFVFEYGKMQFDKGLHFPYQKACLLDKAYLVMGLLALQIVC